MSAARVTQPKPRIMPPEVRRAALMDAAEALFLAKGIAGTSIDDIVAAANVAKGTFYLYFASKDRLLAALQERFVQAFCAHVEAAVARHAPDDWRGRLMAWVEAGVEGYLDRVAVHDVVFHEFRPEDRRDMNRNPLIDALADFLAAGDAAGAWTVEAPRLMAVMLFNALHGAVDDAVIATAPMDRSQLVHVIAQLFERAVSLAPGSQPPSRQR